MSTMSKNSKGVLVSFEGPDGVGKSTQIRQVETALQSVGKMVAVSKLPAYDKWTGKLIRRMLKSGTALTWPNLFQLCQWLDKIIFQWFVLPKLLKENDYILLDRWHASMWAYGLAGGANETLTDLLVSSVREPDVVLVFSGRCKRDGEEDAYEADSALQKSVRIHYVLWACTRKDNTKVIDADNSRETVTKDALAAIYSIS